MALIRTCGNCTKKYSLPNVEKTYAGNTVEHDVTCPHCHKNDGTVQAPPGTSVIAVCIK